MKSYTCILALAALLASCGGRNQSQVNEGDATLTDSIGLSGESYGESNQSQGNECDATLPDLIGLSGELEFAAGTDEAGQSRLEPPFTITAVQMSQGGERIPLDTKINKDGTKFYGKNTYIIEVEPNGKYKGVQIQETNNRRSDFRWWTEGPIEIEGRWTLESLRMGTGYLHVYEFHLGNGRSLYVPEDGECLYLNQYDCADLNTAANEALEIIETTKTPGKVQSILAEYNDPEASEDVEVPEPWGQTFEVVEGDIVYVMEFDNNNPSVKIGAKPLNEDRWINYNNEGYKFKGNQIYIELNKGFKATVSKDGTSIRTRNEFGEKRTYKVKK